MNPEKVCADVYEEYAHKVKGHLYNRINNREDADDIFQEVFYDFLKALEKFRGEAKAPTLLYVIMRRRIADYMRMKYRNPDYQYVEEIENQIHMNIYPLNILIAMSQGETKSLLLAIKKTKERSEE